MMHGTAITGVTLVDHHKVEPHPGRSHTSLLTFSKTSVATTFKPSVRTTIQLNRSSSVEEPNVIIDLSCDAMNRRARSPLAGLAQTLFDGRVGALSAVHRFPQLCSREGGSPGWIPAFAGTQGSGSWDDHATPTRPANASIIPATVSGASSCARCPSPGSVSTTAPGTSAAAPCAVDRGIAVSPAP